MIDIYFEPNYGKLYEKVEGGTCEVFNYKSDLGNIHHVFIKRLIPFQVDNSIYFDIVTPYGYGGPIITDCNDENKGKLAKEFLISFQNFCEENNIVSEFVRFHPLVNNALDFSSIYTVENIRKTVGTRIEGYNDPINSEFSKSARKTIRKVLNQGVKYRVLERPTNIGRFKEIYYSTMDRTKAADYYYFDNEYFNKCLTHFKDNLILVEVLYKNRVIAAGFYFIYGNIVHAHLSGTLEEYLHLSPAYIIKYATVEWAKEKGMELIHYGGGTSNRSDDPLYQFKKKFGKNTEFDFYIGKKVWNENIYNELCMKINVDETINYFPLYRYNLKG